jgi:isopentenyl-diphosphate delta-isomerase
MEQVILVDFDDKETGIMEKQQAHIEGRLHRAISVFIFNTTGEMLLQQRAADKYHSPNLWTNTCCSHPRPGETVGDAASRRLREEMGMEGDLHEAFSFIYQAKLDNGLTEYEFDHVFIGITNDTPQPDGSEVRAWQYAFPAQVEKDINDHPEKYTEWFKICLTDWRTQLFSAKH